MDAKIVFDDYTAGANNGLDDVTAKIMLAGGGGGNVPPIEVKYVRDNPIEVGLANIEVSFYSSEIIT